MKLRGKIDMRVKRNMGLIDWMGNEWIGVYVTVHV